MQLASRSRGQVVEVGLRAFEATEGDVGGEVGGGGLGDAVAEGGEVQAHFFCKKYKNDILYVVFCIWVHSKNMSAIINLNVDKISSA